MLEQICTLDHKVYRVIACSVPALAAGVFADSTHAGRVFHRKPGQRSTA
jgi:hypothetical protein